MSRSLCQNTRTRFTLPVFLTPAFVDSRIVACTSANIRTFSSSTCLEEKKRKGVVNKQRGVSALRSTGPRTRMSLSPYLVMPQPVKDVAARRAEFDDANDNHALSKDHGLWQFFNTDRSSLLPPLEEGSHGRAWTVSELSKKDFTDLWKLYWVCVKEANQVMTRNNERDRVHAGYGTVEAEKRLKMVQLTQRRIRKVLLDRHDQFNNTKTLLEIKEIKDLLPDAESEIGLGDPTSLLEPEYHITEVDEKDMAEGQSELSSIESADKQPSDQTSLDHNDPPRRQKLKE